MESLVHCSLPDTVEAPAPLPLKMEPRAKICAQNTVAAQSDPLGLKLENKTKSSADGKPGRFQWLTNCWSSGASLLRETPKKTGEVVTFKDLTQSVPTLCLKLKNKAKDKKPCEPGFLREAEECVGGMFRKAEAELHLEEEPATEALERNEKQLDAIFDKLEERILQLRREVKTKFRTLTVQQQKEVLAFWESAEEFIGMILDWLCQMFHEVLAKIRQGFVIEKDALKGVFEVVAGMLKLIF